MTNKHKVKVKDFIPLTGAVKCITRYVYGVRNLDNSHQFLKYATKGTAEIVGLAFYNAVVIRSALYGLEKILN